MSNSGLPTLTLVPATPICRDCEWVATSTFDWTRWRCLAPENKSTSTINLVTGEEERSYTYSSCQVAREMGEGCGKAGKWFKVREFKIIKEAPPADLPKISKRTPITADDL